MQEKTRTSLRCFTLIEVMIVVTILGVLAAISYSHYAHVSIDVSHVAVRRQLQSIRQQIDIFRAATGTEPRLVAKQWDDLVLNDYLVKPPVNTLNGLTSVKGAARPGAGWVWRPTGRGKKQVFATDETTTAEYAE